MTVAQRVSNPAATASGLEWVIRNGVPSGWPEAMQVCGGGFFHSPPGLLVGAPRGEPFYLDLWRGNELVGVSAGVRHACRFSKHLKHVYIPTLPAIRNPLLRAAGVEALRDAMRAEGAEEIVIDTFDSPWDAGDLSSGDGTAPRTEYVVHLEGSSPSVPARYAATHRRHCSKGERLAWTVRPVHGADAAKLVSEVQQAASDRAATRGAGFLAEGPQPAAFERACADDPWGVTAFAGWDGDNLLAAVVIGWANRRAFYVSGGSTPDGYAQGAAAWLHWRVMQIFADRGFKTYNLGGTPATARFESDPAHGLWRFKTGFDAHIIDLRGVRWEMETPHVRGHRVKRWMTQRYDSWLH
jgi:hypothetical protein